MQEETTSMEERILRVMRSVLIDVVKDTPAVEVFDKIFNYNHIVAHPLILY